MIENYRRKNLLMKFYSLLLLLNLFTNLLLAKFEMKSQSEKYFFHQQIEHHGIKENIDLQLKDARGVHFRQHFIICVFCRQLCSVKGVDRVYKESWDSYSYNSESSLILAYKSLHERHVASYGGNRLLNWRCVFLSFF